MDDDSDVAPALAIAPLSCRWVTSPPASEPGYIVNNGHTRVFAHVSQHGLYSRVPGQATGHIIGKDLLNLITEYIGSLQEVDEMLDNLLRRLFYQR